MDLSSQLLVGVAATSWQAAARLLEAYPFLDGLLHRCLQRHAFDLEDVAREGLTKACAWLLQHRPVCDVSPAFMVAGRHGSMGVCLLLARRRPSRTAGLYALRWAARKGFLMLCMWLTTHFQFTRCDIMAVDNFALRGAARNGHLEVCKWIVTWFKLTVSTRNEMALYVDRQMALDVLGSAMEGGRVDVCEWVRRTFFFCRINLRELSRAEVGILRCRAGRYAQQASIEWLDERRRASVEYAGVQVPTTSH